MIGSRVVVYHPNSSTHFQMYALVMIWYLLTQDAVREEINGFDLNLSALTLPA